MHCCRVYRPMQMKLDHTYRFNDSAITLDVIYFIYNIDFYPILFHSVL